MAYNPKNRVKRSENILIMRCMLPNLQAGRKKYEKWLLAKIGKVSTK